jgi:hypothetical protein
MKYSYWYIFNTKMSILTGKSYYILKECKKLTAQLLLEIINFSQWKNDQIYLINILTYYGL